MFFWILVLLLTIPLTILIARFNLIPKIFALLSALTISPLILGWVLYLSFYLIPGGTKDVHLFCLYLFLCVIWILVLFLRKNKTAYLSKPNIKIFSFTETTLFVSIILILLMVSIRAVLWPPTWYDQLLYIKQSFVFSIVRDIRGFVGFHNLLNFNQGGVSYQLSSSIRPGLTMIYTLILFFTNSIQKAEPIFASVAIFYLWLLTSLVVTVVKRRKDWLHGLLAGFLLTTCYYMINFSIYGYKEIAIMCLLVLALVLLDEINTNQKHNLFKLLFLGFLLGLMSFVGYVGSVIGLILLFLYFIFQKEKTLKKVVDLGVVVFSMLICSAMELFVFKKWLLSGFKKVSRENSNLSNVLRTPLSVGELESYKIFDNWDVYLKGKFQGFFQIQFYGLVFWLFLLVLILNWKKIIKNNLSKLFFVFVIFYSFIFFDPFLINPHRYVYVLSVSPKYVLILVPLVSILIGLSANRLIKMSKKISLRYLLLIFTTGLTMIGGVFKVWPEKFLWVIKKIVPLFLSDEYYLNIVNQIIKIFFIFFVFFLLFLTIYLLLYGGRKLTLWWKKLNLSFLFFLLIFFLSPFMFFYNSNYGIYQSFSLANKSRGERLENVPSMEGFYKVIDFINNEHPDSKILLLNQTKPLVQYFLDGNDNYVLVTKDLSGVIDENLNNVKAKKFENFCLNGADLILIRENSQYEYSKISKISTIEVIKKENSFILCKCRI